MIHFHANRLLACASAPIPANILKSIAPTPSRYVSTMSGGVLTQHDKQSTIYANDELVGQCGRRYLVERVLQWKESPPSQIYLATWAFQ